MRADTCYHRCVSLHHWRKSHFKLGLGVSCSLHDGQRFLTPRHKVLVVINVGHNLVHFQHRIPKKKIASDSKVVISFIQWFNVVLVQWNYPSILRSEYSFLLLVKLMKCLLWGALDVTSLSWRVSALGVRVIRMPHDAKCLRVQRKWTAGYMTDSWQLNTSTANNNRIVLDRGGTSVLC